MLKKSTALFLFIPWLFLVNSNKVLASEIESDEVTVSTTISGTTTPSTTPTPTPTTTATATPTVTETPTATALVSPTPLPTPLPEGEKLLIFGYGPSFSKVFMEGIGVSENTETKEDGYFEFDSLSFPTLLSGLIGNLYPEICIWSMDLLERKTPPVCIPPLPIVVLTRRIGPILLPPTLGIERSKIPQGVQVIAFGTTTPNTEVNIFLAKKNIKNLFQIIPQVSALVLPEYTINSNQKGYFEFSLPTSSSDKWTVFAASDFQGNNSPKSYSLSFEVKGPVMTVIQSYEDMLRSKRPGLLLIIIIIEILIVVILLIITSKSKTRHKKDTKQKYHNISKNISQLQNEYKKLQKEYEDLLREKIKPF